MCAHANHLASVKRYHSRFGCFQTGAKKDKLQTPGSFWCKTVICVPVYRSKAKLCLCFTSDIISKSIFAEEALG